MAILTTLFRRNTFIYYQFRHLHRSTNGPSIPSFNMDTEKKAFLDVLPEVINSVVTSPKFTDIPEVRSWIKKLLEYTVTGGKLGRGLMVSIGYRMFEEPGNYSEETQHSARVLGWCVEMILDDIYDGGTIRRGKPCWHLQPNVGLSAINDALLVNQSTMTVLDLYFGKTPIFTDLLRQFNETVNKITVGVHLDLWSSYNKEKNNIDVLNTDRIYRAIADHKFPYYSFKLPIFLPLLLVKDGKNKATNELNNICMDFGRLMQCQDDYKDAYGDEAVTGKTGRDIQEGKCSWVAVTALQHCNDTQRDIFKEYYGSKDPEHVKRIKQLYDALHLPQLYEQCERTMYVNLMRRILEIPHEGTRIFLLYVLNGSDIVVMAENMEDISTMLDDRSRASERVGLKMNIEKTKVMLNALTWALQAHPQR